MTPRMRYAAIDGKLRYKSLPVHIEKRDMPTHSQCITDLLRCTAGNGRCCCLHFPMLSSWSFCCHYLCAWLYTRYITRPVLRLSATSKRMAESGLFRAVQYEDANDELGCLAHKFKFICLRRLSTVYWTSSERQMQQLRTDMEKEQELERQRVDFFASGIPRIENTTYHPERTLGGDAERRRLAMRIT